MTATFSPIHELRADLERVREEHGRRSSQAQAAFEALVRGAAEAGQPIDTDHIFFPYGYRAASGAVTWADPFRPLADRTIRSWWDKVTDLADVRYRSLHMNRHTLGTNLSDAGEGLETIQDFLGHSDPKTAKMYVHNSRSRLQRGRGALDAYRKAQGS